jgi:hypothetical protein
MNANAEFGRMWKDVVVDCHMVVYQNLFGSPEENRGRRVIIAGQRVEKPSWDLRVTRKAF